MLVINCHITNYPKTKQLNTTKIWSHLVSEEAMGVQGKPRFCLFFHIKIWLRNIFMYNTVWQEPGWLH